MLRDTIERVQNDLRSGGFPSEAAVSQGVVLPLLQALNWPVFDTQSVTPQYEVEGTRVDFALCDGIDNPKAFLEVKRVGQLEGGDRQLFQYAFHRGVPLAILTDGQEWSFYLPAEPGLYDERRVYKLDLLERDVSECERRFMRCLAHDAVVSGKALEAARADHQDVTRARQIDVALPKAWAALISQQDELLLELLADKVEDVCGYRPYADTCARFLQGLGATPSAARTSPPTQQSPRLIPTPSLATPVGVGFDGARGHANLAHAPC